MPQIPPELLGTGGTPASNYPSGPYGTVPGATLANLRFQGYRAPERALNIETLSLADFYAPQATGARLLLLNAGSIWCAPCQVEHRDLPAQKRLYTARGLEIVGVLVQDAERNPATLSQLQNWVQTFGTNFPMGIDPQLQMGVFRAADTAPINLVIDLKTMRLLELFVGDQRSVLWAYIDHALESL